MDAHQSRAVRAVIYARISKDKNGDGLGVERQIESCTHLAAAREWQLVRPPLIDNDISAFTGKRRPAYEQLLTLIETRQVDAVLVWAMDRMTRRVAELVDVIALTAETGVRIATVSGDLDLSSPMGRMLAKLVCSVAEYEAEQKGLRHQAANDQAARNGKRRLSAPRPFGYSDDYVTVRADEADAIRWAADALLHGSTLSAVLREWERRGVRPAQNHGRQWTRNSVKSILTNPRLAGYAVMPRRPDPYDDYAGDGRKAPRLLPAEIVRDDQGDPVLGEWAAILAPEVWEAVASLLEDPARKIPRGVRSLLGGLAACQCGNAITGSRNEHGHIYRCVPATRTGPGPHVAVKASVVDDYVSQHMIARLSRPDLVSLITPETRDDGPALRTEAAAIRRNLDELAADRALGLITREQMLAATRKATGRLEKIAGELASAAGTSALTPFLAGQLAADVWDGLDLPRRRAVIASLCTVVLHPVGRGRRFDGTMHVTVIPITQ